MSSQSLPPASLPPASRWVAVVLAGGTSRRWGGVDKTAVPLAGAPLLLHAVTAVLPDAQAVAVVAPAEHPARDAVARAADAAGRPVAWTREDPPGGGPLAGLAAGLAALPELRTSGRPERAVAVLAGDLPFTRTVWRRLVAALAHDPTADAALGLDPAGHRQPLLGLYRERVLRSRLAEGPVIDQPLRVVMARLAIIEVPVTELEALDLDTPDDAATARALAARARAARTLGPESLVGGDLPARGEP